MSARERKPLSAEETEWAAHLNMSPEDYADLKEVRNLDDWNAYVEQKAANDE